MQPRCPQISSGLLGSPWVLKLPFNTSWSLSARAATCDMGDPKTKIKRLCSAAGCCVLVTDPADVGDRWWCRLSCQCVVAQRTRQILGDRWQCTRSYLVLASRLSDLGWCFVFEALFLLSDGATDAKQDGINQRKI